MTGFKSKKALSDRLADAEKEGLRQQNEWQLGMDKLQREIDALKAKNAGLMLEIDCFHQENARTKIKLHNMTRFEQIANADLMLEIDALKAENADLMLEIDRLHQENARTKIKLHNMLHFEQIAIKAVEEQEKNK